MSAQGNAFIDNDTYDIFISDESLRQTLHASVLERLYSDYPGDVGCFGIYFFNFITMQPGEAIYIGPNEPHAYLSGGKCRIIYTAGRN